MAPERVDHGLAVRVGCAKVGHPLSIVSLDVEGRRAMTLDIGTYEEAVAAHEWRVPERYNIAVDCCDKHPADKLAMIHEDFEGTVRQIHWGELQEWSNRFAPTV
jgi:hypothetical protein